MEAAYTMVIESQDHLRPWMPWAQGYTRGNAADYLAACEHDWQTGAAFNYAITAGGRIVGCCGLMARITPGGLEIGYWVHAAHIRRGLATAAAAALTDAAFRLPGIDHVEIVHDELNEASGAVPRKLGFTEVGSRSLDIGRRPGPASVSSGGSPAVSALARGHPDVARTRPARARSHWRRGRRRR